MPKMWNKKSVDDNSDHLYFITDHLLPFLDENLADGRYYLLSNLASAHYPKKTVDRYKEEKWLIIPKAEILLFALYWAIDDFEFTWPSKSTTVNGKITHSDNRSREFIKKFREVDVEQCQRLFQTVKTKLNKGLDQGTQAANNHFFFRKKR